MTERYYHQIEDSDKWEIHVKYREIVSQFLFADGEEYVDLAKYLLNFLSEGLG